MGGGTHGPRSYGYPAVMGCYADRYRGTQPTFPVSRSCGRHDRSHQFFPLATTETPRSLTGGYPALRLRGPGSRSPVSLELESGLIGNRRKQTVARKTEEHPRRGGSAPRQQARSITTPLVTGARRFAGPRPVGTSLSPKFGSLFLCMTQRLAPENRSQPEHLMTVRFLPLVLLVTPIALAGQRTPKLCCTGVTGSRSPANRSPLPRAL